jgi:hypothetical protein
LAAEAGDTAGMQAALDQLARIGGDLEHPARAAACNALFAFIPEPQRSQMRKLEQSALQTPRNRTHGNYFKVSILCLIHSTFAPHLSQVSMVSAKSMNRAESPGREYRRLVAVKRQATAQRYRAPARGRAS